MPRSVILSIAILAGTLLSGCQLPFRGAGLTFEQSKVQTKRFVDAPLAKALAGAPFPRADFTVSSNCVNSLDRPSGKVYPTFTYRLPLALLGENPERLIKITESFWRTEGFEVLNRDDPELNGDGPVVRIRDAFLERGFTAHVMVNYFTDMALITASGPCAEPPAGA